ncbi:MAG: hypothetical protein KDB71_21095 [Mycobacterium sp.]|nr:hypothetical protein [Mycobacterium sp.]
MGSLGSGDQRRVRVRQDTTENFTDSHCHGLHGLNGFQHFQVVVVVDPTPAAVSGDVGVLVTPGGEDTIVG